MKAPEEWEERRPETVFWAQRMSPDAGRRIMMRRRRWET
jgi:ribosomal protein L34